MDERFGDLIKDTFRLREYEGSSKVMPLHEAVERFVRPGMMLHMGMDAGAAACEVLRQYYGKKPDFGLAISIMSDHSTSLIHAGLVTKLITSNTSDLFLPPGPSPIIQRAYRDKGLSIENWSLFTLIQRYMAAALDIGFMPTRSLVGSTMCTENKDSFTFIDNPFNKGERLGLVKALAPDLSIIHAWAADPYGNTITILSDAEGLWGAKASKEGVLVTVEKIVSTDYIRAHSPLVTIPGYRVKSVSLCPFGAHPRPMVNRGMDGIEPYSEDRDFVLDFRKANKNPETMDGWLREWVLDVSSHDDYLHKLGQERLHYLREKAHADAWEQEIQALAESIPDSTEHNPVVAMVVAAGRKLRERILRGNYRVVLTGQGTPSLAAWLAYYQLRKEGYDLDLTIGSGPYGYSPRPANPSLANFANFFTAKMMSDTLGIYGIVVGGMGSMCLGVVGGAQIDKYGNINSTLRGDGLYLVGAGGSADVASRREVVAVIQQSTRRFVDRLPYISMPGERVKLLISQLGIFEKVGEEKEFTLTACLPGPKARTKEECIREAKANCGWDLKVSENIQVLSSPTGEELTMLRLLDPRREYTGE